MTIVKGEAEIFNEAVTLGGGVKYSAIMRHHPDKTLSVTSEWNQGSGDIVASLTLESRKVEGGIGFVPEPLAVFEAEPDGSAGKSVDNWTAAASKEYRVKIEPTGGTSGPIRMEWSS